VPRPFAALAAAAAAGALAAGLLVGVPAAGQDVTRASATETPRPGAVGIGDDYFPLDGNSGIDVQRYDIHVRYRFASERLTGWTRLRVRGTAEISRFNLDFLLPVSSVRVDGRPVDYRQGKHELTVKHALQPGEVVDLRVAYAGRPRDYTYAGEMNWLADRHEVVTMNQPHMAPWWFPANDHPRDRARIHVHVTAPKGKQVVSNGTRVGRAVHGRLATTHWSAEEPMTPYLAFFAVGDFEIESGRTDGRLWYAAVSRQLPRAARAASMNLMKRTPALLGWLETLLGDYPFSTTGGLTTRLPVGFALENQTRPLYPPMYGNGAVAIVVHELAHQWFGDSVTVHGWRHIWLNEGLATFFEKLYAEHVGDQSAADWLRERYDAIPADRDFWQHRLSDPCPAHTGCVYRIFADWVYVRGAMAVQALRNVIDDDAVFFAMLRDWAADRAGTSATVAEFEAHAEASTGLDLDDFFEAWLHTPQKPRPIAANGLG